MAFALNIVRLIGILLVIAGGAIGYDGPAHAVFSWQWFAYVAGVALGVSIYGASTSAYDRARR